MEFVDWDCNFQLENDDAFITVMFTLIWVLIVKSIYGCTLIEAATSVESNDMVQCDFCDNWYHFRCVGVTKKIENLEWTCQFCVQVFSGN